MCPSVRNLLAAWAVVSAAACSDRSGLSPRGTTQTSNPTSADWFVDHASDSGLRFTHVNGMSGQMYIAEIMGPGVAFLDYDNDGDLDVYAVQGGSLQATSAAPSGASGDRLFRNDLTVAPDGARTLRFTDVTTAAGLSVTSYGMGVATGDYDNDGWVDLYLTRFGGDVLLKNLGNGTFADVTSTAGLTDPGWTVAATFFDFDRDGWLDLYVGSYLRYAVESDITCIGPTGARDYCSPQNYSALPGRLFKNLRNGSFADVTVASAVATEYGPALGAQAFDANADGWLDLYVANDGSPNQLWVNQRNGRFQNTAALAGVAVNGNGRPEGSMGVDAADFDGDGDEDILVTNLTGEGTTLYANDGDGVFDDLGAASTLRSASLPFTGFGTAWLDVDNDGQLDVLTVNGAIQTIQALAQAGDPFPLHQRKQLFRNRGDRRFEDVTAPAGQAFTLSSVGRGAAFGDVDNDGDVDVLVGVNNGPLQLLMNQRGSSKHWLGVRAVGAKGVGGRDLVGARVGVVLGDGATRWRRVRTDGSYASAHDPRVLVGLGDRTDVRTVRVEWPDGTREEHPQAGVDRWVTVAQSAAR